MNLIYSHPLYALLDLFEALLEQTDLSIQERAQFQALLDTLRSEAAICQRRSS
jgi:hypothetical protein